MGDISAYVRDNAHDLLTAAEEVALARVIRDPDAPAAARQAARQRLAACNLRLVVSIARAYVRRGLPLEDLVGEGNVGLVEAAGRFDPGRGTRFSTFATCWIKRTVQRAAAKRHLVRIPPDVIRQLLAVRRAEARGGAAAVAVADAVADAARAFAAPGGLREHETPGPPQPDRAEAEEELRRLAAAVGRLDPRLARVVRLRYGESPVTLQEVGTALGVSHQRVKQIQDDILDALHLDLTGEPRDRAAGGRRLAADPCARCGTTGGETRRGVPVRRPGRGPRGGGRLCGWCARCLSADERRADAPAEAGPCARCGTTAGYVRAGSAAPYRASGSRYGFDGKLCKLCEDRLRWYARAAVRKGGAA